MNHLALWHGNCLSRIPVCVGMKNILMLGSTEGYILGQLQNSRTKKVVNEEWHRRGGENVALTFLHSLQTVMTYRLCSHPHTHNTHTHTHRDRHTHRHIHTHTMKRQPAWPFQVPVSLHSPKQTFIRITSFVIFCLLLLSFAYSKCCIVGNVAMNFRNRNKSNMFSMIEMNYILQVKLK